MISPRSVYVHVPFCARRCGYCDFTLVAGKDWLVDGYLDSLEHEIDRWLGPGESSQPVETVFFGGGTPTQLDVPRLQRLLELIARRFPRTAGAEFSVEANPDRLSDDKLDALAAAGVNRLSLGVQSFDHAILEVLEREHRLDDLLDTIRRVQGRFGNVSFDLIFSVPGQSLSTWERTLQTAIELGPAHVSTYGLTWEKGTSFWSRREKGQLQPVPEELDRRFYAAAMDHLTGAGFEQYEISSFARPGYRCRHNQVYWTGGEFLGLGPGAASLIGGERRLNHRSVTTWLKKIRAGESAVMESERLSPHDRARERLVLGLRRIEGVDRAEFAGQTGFEPEALAGPELAALTERGWLIRDRSRIRLTREGRFFADSVAGELLTSGEV